MLIEMQQRLRKQDPGPWAVFASWTLRKTIGYGLRPLRAISWLLGLTALGFVLFGLGYLGGAMVPTDKEAYGVFEQRGYPPVYYSQFNPLIYSFERSFPLVNLGVNDRWQPAPGGVTIVPLLKCRTFRWMHDRRIQLGNPTLLRGWMWIQTLTGWILATLFVVGLTGIVKSA